MAMCIVAFAWKAHPRWQLIVIGNRDELHARPASPLNRWDEADHLLAGRDMTAGGTWLGVSEQGRFAVITNLYGFGEPSAEKSSRGDLLKDFLSGKGRHANIGAAKSADFNPFNLITVEKNEAFVHANRPGIVRRVLSPGVHGLSNGPIDRPWPKSPHLNAALEAWMAAESEDPMLLFDNLLDETTYAPKNDSVSTTPSKSEPEHSAVFIRNPIYGTRCSTVVAIDNDGNGQIIERRYVPSGASSGETRLSFSWPNNPHRS